MPTPSPTTPTRLLPQEMPNLLLGRYRVLEERGKGGFGTVSVCWDPRLTRRVAIKVIPLRQRAPQGGPGTPGRPADFEPMGIGDARVTRTLRGGVYPHGVPRSPRLADMGETPAEAEALAAAHERLRANALLHAALAETRTASMLAHPNIVSMLDFESDEDNAYIIMEYVEGASLAELLDSIEGATLTNDEAAAVAEAVGEALTYAHENGVLHLDIKPDNILIDGSGRVRLADFGMATLSSATGFTGAAGGTIGYMPPEQIMGSDVDVRTDVFAFATVMYEALTGVRPFAASTTQESLDLVCSSLADPCVLNELIDPQAADALLVALDPDPDIRQSSVEGFVDELRLGLGNPRAGRRSLADLVAAVTNDEVYDDEEEGLDFLASEGGGSGSDWGVLARRAPSAPSWLFRLIAAIGAALLVYLTCLSWLPATQLVAAPNTGSAIGTAAQTGASSAASAGTSPTAGFAPAAGTQAQASSGSRAVGFSPNASSSTVSVVIALVVAVIGLFAAQLAAGIALVSLLVACVVAQLWPLALIIGATSIAWWILVARSDPHSAGIPLLACTGASLGGPVASLLGGFSLAPHKAALSALLAFSICLAMTCLSASASFGAIDPTRIPFVGASMAGFAFQTLAGTPATWLHAAGWAAGAAVLSGIAQHGGPGRCYLGAIASGLTLLGFLLVVARMENGGSWTPLAAGETAGVLASAILVAIITYLVGTPRVLFGNDVDPGGDAGSEL